MISISEVEAIHNILIDKFGGAKGIRDLGALESAVARPFATFDQVDLYSTPIDKAAAILESLLINHPFIDGNKRIGYTIMRLILLESGFDIYASQDEKYKIVISVSTGESRFEDIRAWLNSCVK
ncbi:type II toxin-antitoxin system death-on-curing family toxin [Flavobacterium silvaticum]|uniref:Type II toxin-antitoxin system death-on-curing family toxin n=1 Tax=Flavobacterium silvaticum TaxID=1852020 RepID=A0A972JET5_9FLAO|nr:type II toxin-antitoxin system death-on-curing family toxin [Flavobacterium silvaticum]NMH26516.1 type II toxin-antitoxin system death-on-curing family toxin [Flavobacterium silvaticum]